MTLQAPRKNGMRAFLSVADGNEKRPKLGPAPESSAAGAWLFGAYVI